MKKKHCEDEKNSTLRTHDIKRYYTYYHQKTMVPKLGRKKTIKLVVDRMKQGTYDGTSGKGFIQSVDTIQKLPNQNGETNQK